jgi:hypothetical protein
MRQKSLSLPLLEAGVSVHCFVASASQKHFIGLDTVSPTRMQVLLQRCPRYKGSRIPFKGIVFSFGSSSYPETWIKFYNGNLVVGKTL